MASAIANTGGKPQSVGRGQSVLLGSIGPAAGSVVAFTLPEPTREPDGGFVIMVGSGGTMSLGSGTFGLEFSLDGGTSWALFPVATTVGVATIYALTGGPGSDTGALFAASYTISGFGSGAQFRFGMIVAATSGSAPVYVLYG
jgi:hypothetical protein